jgi:uncharacterized membrane protein (UPF0182 family)
VSDYAVVHTKRSEISYSSTGQDAQVTYQGAGGVSMGSTIRRIAFALRFGEINLFTSGLITGESRILYVRDVRARVELLAPFLDFDSDPYPVIIDGRMKWVIDAYTTTDQYPYAQRADTDALPAGSGLDHRFNYVRNSVKAVVDAYDGSATFYIVDQQDPIVRAWAKAFPKLFTEAVPDELQAHFRYPDDIFRVQTEAWGRYHIEDPGDFYQRSDAWNVAQNPPKEQESRTATPVPTVVGGTLASTRERRVPPYYTLMVQPGTNNVQFVSLRSFVPFSDNDQLKTLSAFMTVSSEHADYGKMRVYVMSSPPPDGPSLADSTMKSNFAQNLTLLDRVVGGSIAPLPGTGAGSTTDPNATTTTTAPATTVPGATTTPTTAPTASGSPDQLLAQAQAAYDAAQAALKAGDLGTYQAKLTEAYQLAAQAASIATGSSVTAVPSSTTTTPAPTDPSTTANA